MKEQHIFFAPDIADTHELPAEESQHAVKVLRMKEGDAITITDGRGFFYEGEVAVANQHRCRIHLHDRHEYRKTWKGEIHLAVAPTKNLNRMEWLCEKATEIGFDSITFLECDFSERRNVNTERLKKILVAAMKQSQKALLPDIRPLTPFKQYIAEPFSGLRFIAHCYDDASVYGTDGEPGVRAIPFLADVAQPGEKVQVLIGPEGDFSLNEVRSALSNGFQPISLGDSRLRTETAALAAVHILNINQRL